MNKWYVLLLVGLLLTPVYAEKSYSSGSGKSVKPSGSSSSKPPSSSSSKPSVSKPHIAPPVHAPTPSVSTKPSTSGKSYSSGTPKPPVSVSPTPTHPPSATAPVNTPSPVAPTVTSIRPPTISDDGKSRKPQSSSFGSAISDTAKREESRMKYEASKPTPAATAKYTPSPTPKPTYKSPTGQTQTIKRDAPQVQTVRNYVTHERYVTYDHRASNFYGSYYNRPYYYNDYYSPFLMSWMLSDAISSQQRALWMYHHQNDMDRQRYSEMLARDSRLQAEIDALKAQNIAQNPGYVPPQMQDNPDVMFNKEFVNASINPVETSSAGFGTFVWYFFLFTVCGAFLVGFVYLFFVKEY